MPSLLDVRLGINPVVQNLIYGYKAEGYIGLDLFTQFPFAYDGGTVPLMDPANMRAFETSYADGAMVNIGELRMSRATIAMHYRNWTTPVTDAMYEQWMFPNLDPATWAAQQSMDVILRGHEVECALVGISAASYNNVVPLTLNLAAAWANPATTMLTTHIFPASNAVKNLIGRKPNVFWCDDVTWQNIQLNTEVRTQAALIRGIATATPLAPELITKEAFAVLIGASKVLVAEGLIRNDANTAFYNPWAGTPAAQTGCAGLAYVPSGGKLFEPSFGYTFRAPGNPAPKNAYRLETHHSTLYEVNDHLGAQIVPPTTGATRTNSGFLWTRTVV
ncbi:MAG TPA: hypothetical protein VMX79_07550 [bacterium]|nr:hypothetical protein [bacterium]